MHDLVAVDDRLARQHLETIDQLLGFAPAVRLDQAGDDIAAARFFRAGGAEHGVGFADARSGAEKNLQMPAAFLFGEGQQRVGRGSLRCVGGHVGLLSSGGNLRRSPVLSSARLSLSTLTRELAKQAKRASFDLAFDQCADARFRQVARLGDARHLKQRRLRRDVGVEAAAGCGHQVHRDRRGRVFLLEAIDSSRDPLRQRFAGRARGSSPSNWRRCRARRPSCVESLGSGALVADGRPWKYLSSANSWPIKAEPITLPSFSIRLPCA